MKSIRADEAVRRSGNSSPIRGKIYQCILDVAVRQVGSYRSQKFAPSNDPRTTCLAVKVIEAFPSILPGCPAKVMVPLEPAFLMAKS